MAIAVLLLILGVGVNVAMFSRVAKGFPRFAKTCEGCGCQAPPMSHPPTVHECPICQWMQYQQLDFWMKQRNVG